ncbi:MAG TPA: hypothetical protein VNO26_06405 [Candidatus Limnocylindria bacterium]|nr:hypothetical protein [Candidatus Limnocylindria bacterium]
MHKALVRALHAAALAFLTDSALRYLDETRGFELGAGPSLTVVDEGFAEKLSTSTLRSDVYAFVFDQRAHGRHRPPGHQDHAHPSGLTSRFERPDSPPAGRTR